jgi:Tol biopolymer transport system component
MKYFTLIIFLSLNLASCSSALWTTPQLPSGGVNSLFPEEYPAYSSDGKFLAFASDRDGSRSIYLYDLEQRSLVNLPGLNRFNSLQDQPALSSDGRYIVYVSTERGKSDIMVYDRVTRNNKLLTVNIKASVRQPTITGDGRYIAFQTNETGQWKIAIVENF